MSSSTSPEGDSQIYEPDHSGEFDPVQIAWKNYGRSLERWRREQALYGDSLSGKAPELAANAMIAGMLARALTIINMKGARATPAPELTTPILPAGGSADGQPASSPHISE